MQRRKIGYTKVFQKDGKNRLDNATAQKYTPPSFDFKKLVAYNRNKNTSIGDRFMAKERKYYFGIFEVDANWTDEVYLCGDSENLGNWNSTKAVKLHNLGNGKFKIRKRFTLGQVVEFKFLRKPDWHDVEKGMWGEEIPNRVIRVYEDKHVVATINNWRMD